MGGADSRYFLEEGGSRPVGKKRGEGKKRSVGKTGEKRAMSEVGSLQKNHAQMTGGKKKKTPAKR